VTRDIEFLRGLLAVLESALRSRRELCDPGRNPVIRTTSVRVEFTKTFED
jgi:hypothetical protein